MKYYNIDLTQFVPYGIPLNSAEKVEYKNHINEFFLRGFERWYNQLFTTDITRTELISDFARSCAAPYSLAACRYYTDNQLEKSIQDAGFVYYAANDHDINAKFVYDLARYPHRTKDYLTSIAQYISNNIDVDVELVYEGCEPYEYDLRLYGDILGSEDVSVMITRLLDHLTVLSTAHTQLRGIEFVETSPILNGNAACVGDNACIYYESIIRDFKTDPDRYITTYSAFKAPSACTYYESVIKEVKPKPPEIDTFDPNVPFCIENVGDVPVEIGMCNVYNSNDTPMTPEIPARGNCKISYDLVKWENYNFVLKPDTDINKTEDLEKITLKNKGDRVYIKADKLETAPDTDIFLSTIIKVINASEKPRIRVGGNIASWNKGSNDSYIRDYLEMSSQDSYCYQYMFKDCDCLVRAPELPATLLADSCYYAMFSGCSNLTQSPVLPAMNLALLCYSRMFSGCTQLKDAPNLPATTLTRGCYAYMFSGCRSLTQAPNLPATTLTGSCYTGMFNGCESLTQAPNLPSTKLAGSCYASMFKNCLELAQAPELPATILAPAEAMTGCYSEMFSGCSKLLQAPHLPATTLTNFCYDQMFSGCSSLTQAPELPATTLAENCYRRMFANCRGLNYIKCSATDISASQCTYKWVSGIGSTGDFYTTAATNWTTGTDGIPSGWTRHNV